jgi:hypothetical protein
VFEHGAGAGEAESAGAAGYWKGGVSVVFISGGSSRRSIQLSLMAQLFMLADDRHSSIKAF